MKITSTDKKVTIEIDEVKNTYPLNYLGYQKTENGITLLRGKQSLFTANISQITVNEQQATEDNIDELLDPLFNLGNSNSIENIDEVLSDYILKNTEESQEDVSIVVDRLDVISPLIDTMGNTSSLKILKDYIELVAKGNRTLSSIAVLNDEVIIESKNLINIQGNKLTYNDKEVATLDDISKIETTASRILTQSEYNSLSEKDENTIYFIKD